jgi:hypothetical protein
MASRFYLCAWEGAGTDENPFVPAAHRFHKTWRAADGRRDPAQPGGIALIEAFDVSPETHAAMIASGDVREITEQNAAAEFSGKLAAPVRNIAEASDAMKEQCGLDNPKFARAKRPAAAAPRGRA